MEQPRSVPKAPGTSAQGYALGRVEEGGMSEENYLDYAAGYNKGFEDAEALLNERIKTLTRQVEELKKTPSASALQARVAWLQTELDRATAGIHWKLGPIEEGKPK